MENRGNWQESRRVSCRSAWCHRRDLVGQGAGQERGVLGKGRRKRGTCGAASWSSGDSRVEVEGSIRWRLGWEQARQEESGVDR